MPVTEITSPYRDMTVTVRQGRERGGNGAGPKGGRASVERPDIEGNQARNSWSQILGAAAQMTGPIVLVCLYVVTRFAAIVIPAGWDDWDSMLGILLLVSAILLIVLHSANLAEHAKLIEQQRQEWAGRFARGEAGDQLPMVTALADRVEMCEMQNEVLAETIADMCARAGVPEVADKVALRIVRDTSRRPVA